MPMAVNYPDIILMVLLIDERPEEVTDGPFCGRRDHSLHLRPAGG
ncbi:hypothetical protein MASR1M66_02020 [Aminivibrio sp.]